MKRLFLAASLLSLIILIISCSQDSPSTAPTSAKVNITAKAEGFINNQIYYGLGVSRIQYKTSVSQAWKDIELSNQGFSIEVGLHQGINIEMRALDKYSTALYTGSASVNVYETDVSINVLMTDIGIKEFYGVLLFDIETSFDSLKVTVEGEDGYYSGIFSATNRRVYNNSTLSSQLIALPRGTYTVTFISAALEYKTTITIRDGYETFITGELQPEMGFTMSPMSGVYFKILEDDSVYTVKIYNNSLANITYSWFLNGIKVGDGSMFRTTEKLEPNMLGCSIFAFRGDSPLVGSSIY